MADPGAFEDPETLKDFLAKQLVAGRLSLVLGAGASFAFDLPDWDVLVQRVANSLNYTIPSGCSNENAADLLLINVCGGDDMRFARVVRDALYDGKDTSMQRLTATPLLVALGALTMASSRGSVTRVLSFNFDDLLEQYLRYHGFVVEPVGRMPHWDSAADVRVFHLHGLLPSSLAKEVSKIVFAGIHFDRVVGRSENAWRRLAVSAMTGNTCLFVGLSGRDANLRSMLADAKELHPAIGRGDAYWGIRFGSESTDVDLTPWVAHGVFPLELSTYAELPSWLLDVCQRAAVTTLDHRDIHE